MNAATSSAVSAGRPVGTSLYVKSSPMSHYAPRGITCVYHNRVRGATAAPAQLRRSSIGTAYPPTCPASSARTITLRDNVLFEERNLSAAHLERNHNPSSPAMILSPQYPWPSAMAFALRSTRLAISLSRSLEGFMKQSISASVVSRTHRQMPLSTPAIRLVWMRVSERPHQVGFLHQMIVSGEPDDSIDLCLETRPMGLM